MHPDPSPDPPPNPSRNPPRNPPRELVRLPAERPSRQRLPKALSLPRRAPVRSTGGRTVVAVLGSVAALGGSAASASAAGAAASIPSRSGQHAPRATRRADPAPPGELALLGLVFTALTAAAPAIAGPLLGRGVAAGDITQAEADAFLARLVSASEDGSSRGAAGGEGSSPEASSRESAAAYDGLAEPTPAAVTLFRTIFDAIRRQLPVIARPLVAEAVSAATVTEAQGRRIEERLVVRAHLRPPAALASGGGHVEPLFTGRLP